MNFSSVFPLLLVLAIKSTVVIGATAIISLGLRRGSAAGRHLVWLLAIAGVLILPLSTVFVPPLHQSAAALPTNIGLSSTAIIAAAVTPYAPLPVAITADSENTQASGYLSSHNFSTCLIFRDG